MRPLSDRIARVLFLCSAAGILLSFGVLAGAFHFFPYQTIPLIRDGMREARTRMIDYLGIAFTARLASLTGQNLPWYYVRVPDPRKPAVRNTPDAYQGLNLVTGIGDHLNIFAKIIDMDGGVIHAWDVDWWEIWRDATHVPEDLMPRSKPGPSIHGVVVLPDGDLVFNFERHGLVRLDRDGGVVWRLPYRTHHSVYLDHDQTLWACGEIRRTESDPNFPTRTPPFDENTVLQVSLDGELLREWSVPELLRRNGKSGYLNLRWTASQLDDRLHLNNVEPFPGDLTPGFFTRGDVLVSLCIVNTVFAFNRETGEITYLSTGEFVRQHDPDFIDGNTYSVFDNRMEARGSRIAIASALNDTVRTFYEGAPEEPFFTPKLGKHQWLPNGDVLITEGVTGRAFEVNGSGEIVWEFVNYAAEGITGVLTEVQRLPADYAQVFAH